MKKIFAFILMVVLCAAVVGCGKTEDKSTASETTPSVVVTITPEATAELTMEPAETETPVPTIEYTPEPTVELTMEPVETETPVPTIEYTPEPTETETPTPTETETPTPTPTEAPKEKDVYYGSLIQDGGSGQIGLVELDGDQLTISGSIYVQPEDEYQGYFDGTPQDNATFTFTVSDSAQFYLVGGDAAPQEVSLSQFVQSAQYYNGLGLILHVEDGVLVKGEISS